MSKKNKELVDGKGQPLKKEDTKKPTVDSNEEIDGLKKTENKDQNTITFNEEAKDADGNVKIVVPAMLPGQGRIIAMIFGKQEIKTESGLILPKTRNVENERFHNPWVDNDYRVVRVSSEAQKRLDLTVEYPHRQSNQRIIVKSQKIKLELGDFCHFGENFIPVIVNEGPYTYAIFHYMDVISVTKSPLQWGWADNDPPEEEE